MRTKTTLSGHLLLLVSMLCFTGCSLFEKDIEAEVKGTFFVNESTEGVNIPYSEFIVIDATDDSDIRDNLDKIKDWSVQKISYSLNGFSGDPSTVFSGAMQLRSAGTTSGITSVSASVQNLNLADLSSSGAKNELNLSATDLATIAGWFDADERIEVFMQGTLSQAPTSFNLVVYIELKVKAKVL